MNTLRYRTHSAAKRAFTLIEIMVATVIMVVLVGLVIQITSEVLKVWSRSSGKLSANAEARIAMDLITQDLESAVFRNNGQQWLRVDAPLEDNYSGSINSNTANDQTVGLKLFSPALDRPTKNAAGATIPGDICAIGYRLSYQRSYDGGPDMYALYRMVVDPQTTFNSYMGSPSDSNSPQLSLQGGLWADSLITDEVNYLVSNIVEFKVLIYELDATTTPALPVANLVNAKPDGELTMDYAFGGTSGSGVSTNQLLYADVILTVVSDEGLEMLENIDRIPETAEQVVQQHGEVFTRRGNFMAQPL